MIEEADCNVLLDVNNIVVSAKNHGFAADTYMLQIPRKRIKQIHLAGYTDCGTYYLDTHGDFVFPDVWTLYKKVIEFYGPIPTMVEWDNDIPEFQVVVDEVEKAKAIIERVEGVRQLA